MNREEARAQHPGEPKEVLVHEAAWSWIVDAIYDRGLMLGPVPQELSSDIPSFIITPPRERLGAPREDHVT